MLDRDRSTVSRPLRKGAPSNALSALAEQMNLRGWQRHRRQMTCPHLRIHYFKIRRYLDSKKKTP
jgi:hypothetical protein